MLPQFLNILLNTTILLSNQNIEIDFVYDFLKLQIHPVQTNAFLCWEQADMMHLAEKLFNNYYKLNIYDITKLNKINNKQNTSILFLFDLDCWNSKEVLNKVHEEHLFASPNIWLFLSRNPENINSLHNLNLLFDSQAYLGSKLNDTSFYLSEIYKYKQTGILNKQFLAIWNYFEGFAQFSGPIKPNIRNNVMSNLIKTAVFITENDTTNHLWDYRFRSIDGLSKLNYIYLNILFDFVNASREFIFVPNIKNMIHLMQNNSVDIAGTPLYLTKQLVDQLDFLSLTTPMEMTFLFLKPPLSHVTNIFTLPFTKLVWLCIFCLVILTIGLLYLVILWETHQQVNQKITFSDVAMLIVGAVSLQDTMYEPKSRISKIITFFIFAALMFIYVSYSAYIVVLLQTSSSHINSVEELLNSKLKLGLLQVDYNHYYFQAATENIRKSIYEQKLAPQGSKAYMTLEEGVERLRKGYFAFHAELPIVYTEIGRTFFEQEKCGLQRLKYVEPAQIWLPIKKNSPYKEILKIGLQKMHEYGIQSRELNKIYDTMPKCTGSGSNFVSVGLIDAGPAFLFLIASLSAAIFIFIFEIVLFICIQRHTISKI